MDPPGWGGMKVIRLTTFRKRVQRISGLLRDTLTNVWDDEEDL